MYQYKDNQIEINNTKFKFKFDIRDVIQYENKYIILLAIPFNQIVINNIYCLDEDAKMVWQSEDLSVLYPNMKNILPYEQMGIKDNFIFASDFVGRNYKINVNDGKIVDFDIVR
mgnify:FL=1